MSLTGQDVTVLGAGVAGLAVGTALARKGAHVTILEQADALREVGAGLQVSPNGAVVLRALGMGAALEAGSLRAGAVKLFDGLSGDELMRLDLLRLRPTQTYHFTHRADLIEMLRAAAVAADVQIRLLQRATEVDLSQDRPRVVLQTGEELSPKLLIGADGLSSRVHAALNGVAEPVFTGQIAWRAMFPIAPGAAPEAEVHMGPARHLVSYPLRGGTLRNIVAVEERDRWAEESWSLRDDPMDLRLAFRKFSPRVRSWLDQIEDVWLWGLFRHPVAKTWWRCLPDGAVAILGDAAHPTVPFLAQGANMALEDAWVIADCLARAATVEAGLEHYAKRRLARTTRIVAAADANAHVYHAQGVRRAVQNLGLRVVSRVAPGAPLQHFDWLYGADVTKSDAA